VAVGDFNGDGRLDLAVANGGDGTVSVLLAKGDGTFQHAQIFPTGDNPTSVAVGDFNGDGRLDLAVANAGDGTVSVLLGKGDGTFQDAQNFPAGSYPYSVAVGDFNGDGLPDLVVAGSTVRVLLGNGDGTFRPFPASHVSYAVSGSGSPANSVAVADFNGDGWLDAVIANLALDDVLILLNDGVWK
jgi:hypothetical protein